MPVGGPKTVNGHPMKFDGCTRGLMPPQAEPLRVGTLRAMFLRCRERVGTTRNLLSLAQKLRECLVAIEDREITGR